MEEIVDETSQRDFYLRAMEENMQAMSIQQQSFQQRERELCEQMAQLQAVTEALLKKDQSVPVTTVPTHNVQQMQDEIEKLKQQLADKEVQEEIKRVEAANQPKRTLWPDCNHSDISSKPEYRAMNSDSDDNSSSQDSSEPGESEIKKKKKRLKHIKEAASCTFEPLPPPQKIRAWKQAFKEEIIGASGKPERTLLWLKDIEHVDRWEDLHNVKAFTTLEAKMTSGLNKIINGELGRTISLIKEKLGRGQNPKRTTNCLDGS
jgi:exonuclease VII large subunit